MMKLFVIAATLACAGIAGVVSSTLQFAARAAQSSGTTMQKSEAIIPLEGLDPVMLAQGKEVQGDEKFSVTRGRFRYLFAGAETKARFANEPERFEIQNGGTCARMGPSTQGNPDLYWVYKERIYIFGSPACVKAFKTAPESYLEPDPAPVLKTAASTESLHRGRALIEKAVEAVGGASKIDALVSYQEKGASARRTPDGVAEIKTHLFVLLPDKLRRERVMPFGTLTEIVSEGRGFYALSSDTRELLAEQSAELKKQLSRNLLFILRARKGEDFIAAATGAGKAGETPIEQVAVSFDSLTLNLGIDPATGRILSLSYRGRGSANMFGDVVQTFSDFRTVEGLTLPFKTTGAFNGEAEPSFTSTIESIVINGAIPPSHFERPATARQ